MAQLPLDSQRATWSHSLSVAACPSPANVRPLPPSTAPLTASLVATPNDDVVGLQCRPLMSATGPLYVRLPRRWIQRPKATALLKMTLPFAQIFRLSVQQMIMCTVNPGAEFQKIS